MGAGHLRAIRALPRDYRAAGPVRVRLKTDDVFQFRGKGVEAVLFGVKLDGGEKSRLETLSCLSPAERRGDRAEPQERRLEGSGLGVAFCNQLGEAGIC